MSREIKFRSYDKKRKKIKFFDLEEIYADCYHNVGFLKNAPHQHENDEWEQFELMQFTGLKDKNGKEIFEGDILSHKYYSMPVVCEFVDGSFIFDDISKYDKSLEVIGNIYENPELINKNI